METQKPVRALQNEIGRLREENHVLKDDLDALRTYIHGLYHLQGLGSHLDEDVDVMEFLDTLLAKALAAVGSRDGSLLLMDEETGDLVFAVVHGAAREQLSGYRLKKEEGIAGWVVANRLPQVVDDAQMDLRFSPEVDLAMDFNTRTLTCVPLMDGERVLGVIEAVNKSGEAIFSEIDQKLLMVLAHMTAVFLVKAEQMIDE